MPKPYSGSTVEIDIGTERARVPAPPEPDTPFRILIAGDFSGRKNRGVAEPGISRRPLEIDRDNFDLVLEQLRPELNLPFPVTFRELEDFEPDRIFDRVALFRTLRQAPAPAAPASEAPAPPRVDLNDLLQETEAREAARSGRALDDFSAMLRDMVAPHLEPRADPRQAELHARLDAAAGALMRELLHHPDFQALEAAWRSLFFLVRRLETGPSLKVYILDVTKEELAAEMEEAGELRSTALYSLLVRDTVGTPGAEPWAVWAGNFAFDETVDDLVLLGYLGGIARAARAPFLAAASGLPEAGSPPCAIWRELRRLPEAAWLGLALPRFLLRLPYGAETCPIERFAFEEMPDGSEHDGYLWGNPALACVYLLGRAFAHSGWLLTPGAVREIDGLPAHVYRAGSETLLKPCAEALLTEDTAERLLERGLMPLVSLKGRDAVRLLRFQSLADPPAPLAGRWR